MPKVTGKLGDQAIESDLAPRRKRFDRLTPLGYEIADPTPMAPPIGYKKSPSLVEQMRTMIRSETLRMEAEAAGLETFEESEDFDVGDDVPDPYSPWENDFDPPAAEIRQAVEEARQPAAKPAAPEPEKRPNPPSDGPSPSPAPANGTPGP